MQTQLDKYEIELITALLETIATKNLRYVTLGEAAQ
jgi:hypothetical protein